MKKKAKKSSAGKRSKKRTETKDLSARKASAVKGGMGVPLTSANKATFTYTQ